ncbi:polyketide cyclase [Vibrio harveyi]|uniref:polyketide cyclase n=1 Tax=Vibrio harveyi TaxID=669 RepID=UPI0003A060AA|nr:polyketide cyclase [Vibrio harveyi]MBY7699342.1 polyketide cyclase [Vibrio harveyi]PNM62564.1 polyketide cyclase [Vibrio harveyi]UIL56477.1 ester cyclase [Vibrio harveyi]SQA36256.1 polyketide cyclase [Vibrio harveyi]
MESNQVQVVRDYFKYCVDGKQTDRVSEYYHATNLIIHRPDCDEPISDLVTFELKLRECVTDRYESIETSFQKIVESGNEVVVFLTHVAKNSNTWREFDVSGKDVTWTALTYFRFDESGKVVEEIVERNELFMAFQVGLELTKR